eukprot:350556-Chlamydomonas_euryale.AAC.17
MAAAALSLAVLMNVPRRDSRPVSPTAKSAARRCCSHAACNPAPLSIATGCPAAAVANCCGEAVRPRAVRYEVNAPRCGHLRVRTSLWMGAWPMTTRSACVLRTPRRMQRCSSPSAGNSAAGADAPTPLSNGLSRQFSVSAHAEGTSRWLGIRGARGRPK